MNQEVFLNVILAVYTKQINGILQAQAQGALYQTTYLQLPGGRRERGDLKVVTRIKVRGRRDVSPESVDRSLAIERIRVADHVACG